MSFTIDIASSADWRELAARGAKAQARAVALTAAALWGRLGEEAPVDEGRLASSFDLEKKTDWLYNIRSGVDYAFAVNDGTQPHEIYPTRPGGVLVFEINGHMVFARHVSHPGTEANPYIDRSIDYTRGRVDEFLRQALNEAF